LWNRVKAVMDSSKPHLEYLRLKGCFPLIYFIALHRLRS
jgi:hypothetical protein